MLTRAGDRLPGIGKENTESKLMTDSSSGEDWRGEGAMGEGGACDPMLLAGVGTFGCRKARSMARQFTSRLFFSGVQHLLAAEGSIAAGRPGFPAVSLSGDSNPAEGGGDGGAIEMGAGAGTGVGGKFISDMSCMYSIDANTYHGRDRIHGPPSPRSQHCSRSWSI